MFKKIFIKLCNEQGVSPSYVCESIGLSNAIYSRWTEDSIPRKATLYKLADYFGVSVDYLLGKEKAAPEEPPQTLQILNQGDVRMIPLFESVSAGFGAYANDYIIDYIPLYIPNNAEAKETICIKVSGDSMAPKIEDGDTIQIRKQDSVDSGTIAVVILDDSEGLVKKVVYGETWIELHSLNPMYKTRRFNGSDVLRVRVVGAVKTIIKKVR